MRRREGKRRRTWPRFERAGHARPRMPSMGSLENESDRVVTGEKYWFFAVTPATVTVSW